MHSQHHVKMSKLISALGLGLACLLLLGCPNLKVPAPTSDTTPPSLVWNVFNHLNRQQADHPGSPQLSAQRGDRYRIMLKANDPEGVKSIKINPTLGSGEMSWQCKDATGELGQNKNATFGTLTQNLSPAADGKVLTAIFLIFELDLDMPCPNGWTFTSGSAQLTGWASNYFAGSTTEVIKFSVSP